MAKGTSKTTTFKVGRDAKTGEFIPVKEANRRPATTVVVTITKTATSGKTIPRKASTGEFLSVKPVPKRASISVAQAEKAVKSYLKSSSKKK